MSEAETDPRLTDHLVRFKAEMEAETDPRRKAEMKGFLADVDAIDEVPPWERGAPARVPAEKPDAAASLPATAVNPLVAKAVRATVLYDMVAGHGGDLEQADSRTRVAILQAQAVRLCIAHKWGTDNPAQQGERSDLTSSTEKKDRRSSVAKETAANRRKIARVPRDRLEAWIDAQLAHPETGNIKQTDFEKSHPYRTEDRRDELNALPAVSFEHEKGAVWTEAMTRRVVLAGVVRRMDGGVEESAARQQAFKEAKRDRDDWTRVQAVLDAPAKDDHPIKTCSCAEMKAHVGAGTLDAIFTDPPYPSEFLHCWDELADFAVHALKPGGLLLTMSGQYGLLEAADRLRVDGLNYRWMVSLVYQKPRENVHATKVSVGWKPMLAFTRDGGHPDFYSQDAFRLPPKDGDKADHDWGQSVEGSRAVAEEWIRPGWRVCDPFCGAGALLEAAKNLGCDVSGCDIEAAHVETARQKLR